MISNEVKLLETKLRDMGLLMDDDYGSPIGFPKICVVGGESVGKSSLIESLVQRDLFPKDSSRMTRRPIQINFEHTDVTPGYIRFEQPSVFQAYLDDENHSLIADEIQKRMGKDANSVEADDTLISLTIFATDVKAELTFVDLPAYKKFMNADGDSRHCEGFLEDESNLIVAVFAANNIEGFMPTLEFVRRFDPEGIRTIGVVTMLDLVPVIDELKDILSNQKYPLKRGYYGVVNRSPEDLKSGQSLQLTNNAEQQFFHENQVYKQVASRMSSDRLFEHLKRLISQCRMIVLNNIQQQMIEMTTDEPTPVAMKCPTEEDLDPPKKIDEKVGAASLNCGLFCEPCTTYSMDELSSSSEVAECKELELPINIENEDGLTVEIVFEGLGDVNPPTIEDGAMAIEGSNYRVSVSSPGANRKVFLGQVTNATDNKYQSSMKARLRRTPWESVEKETLGQSAIWTQQPTELLVTDCKVHEEIYRPPPPFLEVRTSDSLSSIYWNDKSTDIVDSPTTDKDYEDLLEADLVNMASDSYQLPESAIDIDVGSSSIPIEENTRSRGPVMPYVDVDVGNNGSMIEPHISLDIIQEFRMILSDEQSEEGHNDCEQNAPSSSPSSDSSYSSASSKPYDLSPL